MTTTKTYVIVDTPKDCLGDEYKSGIFKVGDVVEMYEGDYNACNDTGGLCLTKDCIVEKGSRAFKKGDRVKVSPRAGYYFRGSFFDSGIPRGVEGEIMSGPDEDGDYPIIYADGLDRTVAPEFLTLVEDEAEDDEEEGILESPGFKFGPLENAVTQDEATEAECAFASANGRETAFHDNSYIDFFDGKAFVVTVKELKW